MKSWLRSSLLLFALCFFIGRAQAQSYCTPAYTYGCAFGVDLSHFSLTGASGTAINQPDTGCSPGSYGDFSAVSASVYAGGFYYSWVHTLATDTVAYAIWLDVNNDGLFDMAERLGYKSIPIASGDTAGHAWLNLSMPDSIAPGPHRLRVRLVAEIAPGSIDPCAAYDEGETHDYTIVVLPTEPCAGAGPEGVMVSSMPGDSVLPYAPFGLSVVGGPAGIDQYYKWFMSFDDGITWTEISSSIYATESIVVPAVTTETCFMRMTFCGGYTGPVVSQVISCVTIMSFLSAYPKYGLGGGCGVNSINKVSITGTSLHNSSNCDTIAGSGIYHAWPNADSFTTAVYKEIPFELKVSTGNDGSPAQIAAWIDYNHNGAFDADEFTLIAASSPSNTAASPAALFSAHSITIPAAALTGLTKMRIRTRAASAAPFTGAMAQASLPDGETEDYFITILEAGPCDTPVVALGADTIICPGVPVALDAGNPDKTHYWNTGADTQILVITTPGTYSVTVADGACSATDSIVVSGVPAPEAGEIFVSGEDPVYNFISYGVSGAATTIWHFGDGATANTLNPTHNYTANGTYDILFIVTNACGQSDTAAGFVTVESLGIGHANEAHVSVHVYPNPTSGQVMVEAKGAFIYSLEIMDNLGRMVLRSQPDAAKTVLDVKGIAQGIYTLRVQTDKGSSVVKLVVKG